MAISMILKREACFEIIWKLIFKLHYKLVYKEYNKCTSLHETEKKIPLKLKHSLANLENQLKKIINEWGVFMVN